MTVTYRSRPREHSDARNCQDPVTLSCRRPFWGIIFQGSLPAHSGDRCEWAIFVQSPKLCPSSFNSSLSSFNSSSSSFVRFRQVSASLSSFDFRCQVFVKFLSSFIRACQDCNFVCQLSKFKITIRVLYKQLYNTQLPLSAPLLLQDAGSGRWWNAPPSQTLYYSRRDDNNWDPDKGVNTTQDQDNQHRLLQESSWRVSVRCILGLHPYPSQHLRSLKNEMIWNWSNILWRCITSEIESVSGSRRRTRRAVKKSNNQPYYVRSIRMLVIIKFSCVCFSFSWQL